MGGAKRGTDAEKSENTKIMEGERMGTKKSGSEQRTDKFQVIAGVVLLGSIWGMLECTLGGFSPSIGAFEISMGAVLAGLFGLGFMAYARRLTGMKWVALGVAVVAGLLRYAAPVGSCVLCSAIAIMAEGVVFELIINRPVFRFGTDRMGDPRTLAYLGVIMGYTIFVTGYIITQILTPILGASTLNMMDVVGILPLILGRGFFAALLGGVSLPLVTLAPQLNIDLSRVRKEIYYPITVTIAALCWLVSIALSYPGIL